MLIVLTVFLHIFALWVFKVNLISCGLPFISFYVYGKNQSRARHLKCLFKMLDAFYAEICGQSIFGFQCSGISRDTCKSIPFPLDINNKVDASFPSSLWGSCQVHCTDGVGNEFILPTSIYRFWRYSALFSLLFETGLRALCIILCFSPTT